MSTSTQKTYVDGSSHISYLQRRRNISLYSFLRHNQEVIVTSTMTFLADSKALNNTWTQHFMSKVKNLLDQKTFDTLENKVRFLFCKKRVTLG